MQATVPTIHTMPYRPGIGVKPRGRLGKQYMAFIAPFRHWVVYPALLRQIERAWQVR